MTFKVVVKVSKSQVLRANGKKIKDALNMLIQVVTPCPDEVHNTYNCKGAYVH